jgi:hypothetical protein
MNYEKLATNYEKLATNYEKLATNYEKLATEKIAETAINEEGATMRN